MLELTIRPIAPYDLAASARGLGDGTRRFRDGVLELHLREGHVRVRQRGDGTLVVAAESDEAFDRAQFVLGADLDHRPFLELAARDGLLRDIIGRRRGVRVLRTATVAHALLKAMCGQLIQASAAIAIERDVLRMLAGRGQVTPPSRDDLVGPLVTPPGAARDWHRGGPTPSCASRARSTWSACTRIRRRPWSRASAASRSSARGRPAWSRSTGSAAPRRGWSATSGSCSWPASLWGRRVETYETAALLEPYGEWAGLASMHLLALSGRTNVRRPVAARGGSRAAG